MTAREQGRPMNEGLSYEEYLDRHGSLTYSSVGVSMLPLLRQGRDLFTVIKKGPERCRPGDVVLFRRADGQPVLHRVLEDRDEGYVIMGDNCVEKEYGIRDGDILGVMTGYVRAGREHSVGERAYKAYTSFIMHTVSLRVRLKKAGARIKGCFAR